MSESGVQEFPVSSHRRAPGAHGISNEVAWAEMLSKIGSKLCRLESVLECRSKKTLPLATSGKLVLGEIEKERGRTARELHAGAGQPLSGILLNLEILSEATSDLPPRAREALARLRTLTDQALQQIRAVSHRLHPPAWQELSAAAAIQNLVETSGIATHYSIELGTGNLRIEPSHAAKVVLYRCVQECLSNIVRHSGATAIQINLEDNGQFFRMTVSDNGHGFSADKSNGGIGLRAIEEQVGFLDGTSLVRTGPSGTEILISIPVVDEGW